MKRTVEVPVETKSTSNLREHWAARHKRTDAQRRATMAHMPPWSGGPLMVVRLTRVSPRRLDDDNLRGALKSVRDGVAAKYRFDDASPLVAWEYAQETGKKPHVRVETFRGAPPALPGPETPEVEWTEEDKALLLPAPRKTKGPGPKS